MNTDRASRLAWSLTGAVLAMLAAASVIAAINSDLIANDVPPGILLVAACAVIGTLAISRQPRNLVGWLFLAVSVVSVLQDVSIELAIFLYRHAGPQAAYQWLAWLSDREWILIIGPLFVLLPLLFPDGRPPSRRWRGVGWLAVSLIFFHAVALAIAPGRLQTVPAQNPAGIDAISSFASPLTTSLNLATIAVAFLCVSSLFFRYRRAGGDERQQVKWFGLGAFLALTGLLGAWIAQALGAQVLSVALGAIGILAVPVGAAIGILRFRLFDIDVVISKAIVYGSLAVLISAVYAGLVAGVGQFAGTLGTPALSAVAAAIVALAFQPARRWLQHVANRLVYGQRATPYEVLSEFADRAAHAYSVDDALPYMAQIVATGIGAARAEVWLRVGTELRRAACWPADNPAASGSVPMASDELPRFAAGESIFPVIHQGDLLGAIVVKPPASDPITADKEKLIANLAAQAGLALRNVRLLEDIRASRQRIITAHDAAARRLERDIHDGAQQQLVALAIKTRLADELVGKDDAEVHQMLAQIMTDLHDTLRDLRDLARGIYPPLLADAGLVSALRAQATKSALPVVIDADGVSRYPHEAETAVYFCALEALQNTAKYASATLVTIRLSDSDGALAISVADDGVGFDPSTTSHGTGIQGMSDRLAALGGQLRVTSAPGTGTRIEGLVPVANSNSTTAQ
jgi:signal transduction histidine kinase